MRYVSGRCLPFTAALGALAALATVVTASRGRSDASEISTRGAEAVNPYAVSSLPASRRSTELSRRLLERRADEDAMDRMLSRMEESAARLTEQKDAGEQTQRAQAAALDAINEAIAKARANQSGSSKSGKPAQGEARRAGQRADPSQQPSKPADGKPNTQAPGKGQGPQTTKTEKRKPLSQQAELRRGWGFLPQRDRDAIIQGAGETFPERYRDDIERYYRALADSAERRDLRRRGNHPRKPTGADRPASASQPVR